MEEMLQLAYSMKEKKCNLHGTNEAAKLLETEVERVEMDIFHFHGHVIFQP